MIAECSSEKIQPTLDPLQFCCKTSHAFLQSTLLAVCKPLLLLFPCLQWCWRQVVRRTMFSFSHSLVIGLFLSCSCIEPVRCSDSLAREGWISLHRKMCTVCHYPRSRLLQHQAGHHLLCLLYNGSDVRQWLAVEEALWQTSIISSAVMSRSSLWRIDGKPPWEQLNACSVENCLSQVHWWGKAGGCQPYLRQRASRNALLCNAKPCSAIGSVDSQLELTFLLDKPIALCILCWSLSFNSTATCDWWCFS